MHLQSALPPAEVTVVPPCPEAPPPRLVKTWPRLCPHQPYKYLDLRPGVLRAARLYNLSRPKREAMEEYINASLAAGSARPPSSPIGAGIMMNDVFCI